MKRSPAYAIKLLCLFSLAFSLAEFPGTLSNSFFSFIHPVRANPAPTEAWYPAGPAVDTELISIFTDRTAELAAIHSASPSIDIPDVPLTPDLINPDLTNPNLSVTSAIQEHGYYEIEFNLANNFWGVNFQFGNSASGIQVRQGLSHLIDKTLFVNNEPSIASLAVALDNPVPTNNGGLTTPNPCAWDTASPQTGPNCVVGAAGGTAYHLNTATGANGSPWLYAPGSPDLNVAAQHFVNAGVATGFNAATSVLTGINPAAATNAPNFFIVNSDTAILHFGDTLAQAICYLFTGSYTIPCTYLSVVHGPVSAFPGNFNSCMFPTTCQTVVSLNWWIYTAHRTNVFPFDGSLYYIYNSRFVSGVPTIQPPCSSQALPSISPPNSMYLCDPNYDSTSSSMEFAPCLSAAGDPISGQVNPTFANCPSTSHLTSVSAGYQAEDRFGRGAYAIPIFSAISRFAYLNGWSRVVNDQGSGVPNYFTWLNAHNPSSVVPNTIRQGFSGSAVSLNPYVAKSSADFNILRNIYDSLAKTNPASSLQLIDWMTTIPPIQIPNSVLPYTPPVGTNSTLRFTLRSDIYLQDSRQLTVFGITFSYLSLLAAGAFQSSELSSITGITILGFRQFDVNLRGVGPFTQFHLEQPMIIPGRYWSQIGSVAWDNAETLCNSGTLANNPTCFPAQYTLNTAGGSPPPVVCSLSCKFPPADLNVDPAKLSVGYDPVSSGILIGSGAFECVSTTGVLGIGCSSSGTQDPPVGGSYTLTRFGKGQVPAGSLDKEYFRSSGNLALNIWSGQNGDFTHDFLMFQGGVVPCFGKAVQPLGNIAGCGHWQQGIGSGGGPIAVSASQVNIVSRFGGYRLIPATADRNGWNSIPGIAPAIDGPVIFGPPTTVGGLVLYEGSTALNPASLVGCTSAYPTGGYDC